MFTQYMANPINILYTTHFCATLGVKSLQNVSKQKLVKRFINHANGLHRLNAMVSREIYMETLLAQKEM